MKYFYQLFIVSSLIIAACTSTGTRQQTSDANYNIDKNVEQQIKEFSLQEKIDILSCPPSISEYPEELPKAIALAAGWDRQMMESMATEISDRENRDIIIACPDINIVRDPRWGGSMKSLGEDPYLTSELAISYIRGIQGKDSARLRHLAMISTFVAFSGGNTQSDIQNVWPDDYDMAETYLPHFRQIISQGNPQCMMCGDQLLRGTACCGNQLMNEIIRDKWGYNGFIISQKDAINNIYRKGDKETISSLSEAVAISIKNGTDLSPDYTASKISQALNDGYLSVKDLDNALRHILKTKIKLSDEKKEKDSIKTFSKATELAANSIVLLKNDHNILPISAQMRKIAIIGPNASSTDVFTGQKATPSHNLNFFNAISKAMPEKTITFSQGTSLADDSDKPDSQPQTLKEAAESDLIIFCGGISPLLEGKSSTVNLRGFYKGDRTDINLPPNQTSLLKALKGLGKPIVLINFSGGAMALNWEKEHIDAIIQAWYPGEFGAQALCSILKGKSSPAGRLPVTFYKSCTQLPSFSNYSMKGRTYRYFSGEPLFEFGYGLSYTTFGYQIGKCPKSSRTDQPLTITAAVTNTGDCVSDEVVQLYVSHPDSKFRKPIRSLQGFCRIKDIKPSETREIRFTLMPHQLAVRDEDNLAIVEPGEISISVGGKQPDTKSINAKQVAEHTLLLTGQTHYITEK